AKSQKARTEKSRGILTFKNLKSKREPERGNASRKPQPGPARGRGRGRAPKGKRGQRQQTERAERMIMSPSAFLRPTLQLAPMNSGSPNRSPCGRNIATSRRSGFRTGRSPRIHGDAKVSSLILQPLVENAVNPAAVAPAATSKS
ncbi:hypothetical protein ACQKGL_22615, partial [Ensifer adhaerens]|uniref:hypothetical protein n=1 Tax=Ensifer adhaerens TaxID=106592 RepID=UPI003CFE5A49